MAGLSAIGEADVAEHALLSGGLRLLVPREHGKNDRLLGSGAPGVAGIERRAHIDDRIDLFHRPFCIRRLGAGAVEVATEAEGEPHLSLVGRVEALERVVALGRRELHAEVALEPFEDGLLERGRHAHSAHALDVGMTADRLQAGTRLSHHPPHEGQLRDRLHRGGAMKLVGHAHRPGEDRPLRVGVLRGDIVDLRLRDARFLHDLIPAEVIEPCGQRRPSIGVLKQEILVDDRVGLL